jgi:hypothetical protein
MGSEVPGLAFHADLNDAALADGGSRQLCGRRNDLGFVLRAVRKTAIVFDGPRAIVFYDLEYKG